MEVYSQTCTVDSVLNSIATEIYTTAVWILKINFSYGNSSNVIPSAQGRTLCQLGLWWQSPTRPHIPVYRRVSHDLRLIFVGRWVWGEAAKERLASSGNSCVWSCNRSAMLVHLIADMACFPLLRLLAHPLPCSTLASLTPTIKICTTLCFYILKKTVASPSYTTPPAQSFFFLFGSAFSGTLNPPSTNSWIRPWKTLKFYTSVSFYSYKDYMYLYDLQHSD